MYYTFIKICGRIAIQGLQFIYSALVCRENILKKEIDYAYCFEFIVACCFYCSGHG